LIDRIFAFLVLSFASALLVITLAFSLYLLKSIAVEVENYVAGFMGGGYVRPGTAEIALAVADSAVSLLPVAFFIFMIVALVALLAYIGRR
jgi:hypothetical protein